MDISAVLTRRLIRKATLSAVGFTMVCAFGATALAQQPSSPSHAVDTQKVPLSAQATRVEDVSLADLDLSTAGGVRPARGRFFSIAGGMCARDAGSREPGVNPKFIACVGNTGAGALGELH